MGLVAIRALAVPVVAFSMAVAALPAAALDPVRSLTQYSRDSWTTRDGLPQNTVHGIAQSPDGYLWLATSVGLARFDGVRFTLFNRANSGLRHDHIWGLFVARDGALWVSTDGGGVARLENGRFRSYGTPDGLAHDLGRGMAQTADGAIWIATHGGGVSRYKDGVFTKIGRAEGLASELAWAVAATRDGAVWIGTNGGGLARLADGRITHLTTADGLPSNNVWTLYEDADGALWAGTTGGLARYHDGRLETFTVRDGLAGNVVRAISRDRHGNLWVGTTDGLSRMRNGRFESLRAADGLTGDFVRALYEDREGSLWIGVFAGGLERLRDGRFVTYGVREGLSHDFVQPILETRDGSLWIGTNGGVLNRMHGGRITRYGPSHGVPAAAVFSLAESRKGGLWIGTNGAGAAYFDGRRFMPYRVKDGLPSDMVRSVLEDSTGTVWLGTADGLVRMSGGRTTTYRAEDGLPGNFINYLMEGREGRLWIATTRGLASWHQGRFTCWTSRDGLPHRTPQTLYEDERGHLWIGTNGAGLSRFDGHRFVTIGIAHGLVSDVVNAIADDGRGHLWLSSPRGISRVERSALDAFVEGRARRVDVRTFDEADGMRSSEGGGGFRPSSWRTRDGRLWFPTVRGAVVVDPAAEAHNALPPPVAVEDVWADGVRLPPGASAPAGAERFAFRYTGLSLLMPSKVQFRYRLEGFDDDWIEAGPQREASYTRLPPGTYRFRVAASNNDGVWNEAGAAFDFRIPPRLHQTPWFYALCAAAALLLAWAWHERRLSAVRRREAELGERIEERTSELQAQIAERWRVEQQLRESEERYALAVRGANDGVWDWDRDAGTVYYSPRWKAILGHDEGEIGDGPEEWFDRVHPDDRERLLAGLEAHCAGKLPHFEDEHRILHHDGTYRWVLCRGFAVRRGDGHAHRVVGVQTDVTDRRSYDPLTGLPNRALFVERLGRSLLRTRHQPGYRIAVLFLDLDRFKVVNDSLGHLVGDRLLVAIARQLESCVRPGDMIARFGGDEFAILVDSMSSMDDAIRVSERILKGLAGSFTIEGNEVFSSASIGIATSATEYHSAEDLLRDADTAMYRAKGKGRSRFEIFDAAMRAHVTALLELEGDLRRAVERSEFQLLYQPIVSLSTGELSGFEALVRWPHARRGLVMPDHFISVAEDTGLIVPLGHWVLAEACRQLRAFQLAVPRERPLTMTVNVSGRQFLDSELVAKTAAVLRESGVDPRSLALEITESVILQTGGASAGMLADLKGLGVEIYIDDFGTGYCSLNYLHRFPVDALKIDRSFVGEIGEGGDSALVRTILALARNLGIAAVAEGVESRDQVGELIALGCERAQGYYFSEAITAERAGEMLSSDWRWSLTSVNGSVTKSQSSELSH